MARAKREGYRSRAAYTLIEMDERFHLLKPGGRIVDLGAAPGGWSQIAADKVKVKDGRGKVVGVDLLDMEPIAGVAFAVKDFNDEDAPRFIKDMLGGEADGVMSDMAANATGHKATITSRSSPLPNLRRISPVKCWRPAASSSPRCCRAAPSINCWRG